jgi:hypothetical protein
MTLWPGKKEGEAMRRIMGLIFGLLLLSGCGGYWMVTDPATKNVYYTDNLEQDKSTGVVKFTDAKTGWEIRMPESQIKEITKAQFEDAVAEK